MDIGYHLPNQGPLATGESVARFAREADQRGAASLWVSDHVIFPRTATGSYPGGRFPHPPDRPYLEPVTVLAAAAVVTSRARLGASVFILGHRHPVVMAKMLTSIDALSNGRLICGVGVGWWKQELEILGAPFAMRGRQADEMLRVFKELWTSDRPAFDGEFYRFSDIGFAPKPVQKPHPPIWVGGESPAALRRAGRLADAWYPIGTNPRFPVGTPAQYAEYAARVKRYAQEAGRDPSTLGFAYSASWFNDQQAQTLPDGQRRPLTGTPQQIADDVKRYEELGVRHMHVNLQGETPAQTVERMQRFADRIMPLTKM